MLHRLFSCCGDRSALQLRCEGISSRWLLFWQSTGSRARGLQQLQLLGSGAQAQELGVHELSCSVACGILPGQGPNLRRPQWQVDSLPLSHQGSPLLQGFTYKPLTPHLESAETVLSSTLDRLTMRMSKNKVLKYLPTKLC